ncbi:hypothetical protein [Nitrospira sp. Kam-Ns4a]
MKPHWMLSTDNAPDPDQEAQRLVLAVIWRAVQDYLGGRGAQAAQRRAAAAAWLFADADEDTPWSFRWCCEVLGLAPECVWRRLARPPEHLARPRAAPRTHAHGDAAVALPDSDRLVARAIT